MFDLSPFVAAAMLTIESQTWRHAGNKERAVRETFNVTMVRYFQMVNILIDTELALLIDPATTRRLRLIRAERQRSRSLRSA